MRTTDVCNFQKRLCFTGYTKALIFEPLVERLFTTGNACRPMTRLFFAFIDTLLRCVSFSQMFRLIVATNV